MTEQSYHNIQTTEARPQLTVEVGNEFFEQGLTQLELRQDGRVRVTNQLDGKQQEYEGQIDAQAAASLIEVAESSIQRMSPVLKQRSGVPDEPRYHFEVYPQARQLLTRDIWRSELERDPELERLIASLQEIIYRISDGQVVL